MLLIRTASICNIRCRFTPKIPEAQNNKAQNIYKTLNCTGKPFFYIYSSDKIKCSVSEDLKQHISFSLMISLIFSYEHGAAGECLFLFTLLPIVVLIFKCEFSFYYSSTQCQPIKLWQEGRK